MATTAQQAGIERVRRAYDAFAKGDMAVINELFADDIVWHIAGKSPLAGDYRGKEAVFGFLAKTMEESGGTFRLEVHDILASDDHTVALVTEYAERNGKRWVSPAVHVTHADDAGRTKEFWAIQQDSAAADEFWS